MTDISSIRTHADPQLTSVAPFSPAPPVLPNGHIHVDPSIEDEESSTIKCICGFHDDDGNTVLCERCNTWQHIACYYESLLVPEIHECADCVPRSVDIKGATERQRQRIRELSNVGERRVKKPASKSHKKKVKETTSAIVTNGWPADKHDPHYSVDRKSGSPRDQPPAKRPKTSHKSSTSVSGLGNGPSLPPNRKRAHSNAANGISPTKSPTSTLSNGYTADYFSPEFLQLYRQGEPKPMQENSYSDIGLTNDLTTWLEDPEALAEVTEGMQPQQVFSRVNSIEDLEQSAPPILETDDNDQTISTNGLYPVWRFLTVDSHVPMNGYIGELTGHVCRKKDYCSSPSNRWERLRHPEPFVFFPPHLPIAIDSRKGGTKMRYARRSCDPNMTMRIFITEGIYHFCFVANREIEPGQELTLPWEVDPDIRRLLSTGITNGNIQKEGIRGVEQVSQWVAGVLSNFGGCACNRARGDCLLERADRRNGSYLPDYAVQPHKASKARRLKKQQVSPLSTGHATNSRAGSEAIKVADPEEDNADTRSVSGSTRSKPGSRDITPMTHISNDPTIGLGVELSDREKRKLMQSERLFEQLEYDEQHGHKRKKRNSAGSTLNTPSATTSKQLGHPDSSSVSTTTVRARSATNGHRVNGTLSRSSNRVMKPPQKPRPVYVDMSTQTEDDPTVGPISNPNFIRRNRVPFYRQLLNRARDERLRREVHVQARLDQDPPASVTNGSQPASPVSAPIKEDIPKARSPSPTSKLPTEDTPASTSVRSADAPLAASVPAPVSGPSKTEDCLDIQMKDPEEATVSQPTDFRKPDPPQAKPSIADSPSEESHPPTQLPAPPWPATPATPATPPPATSSVDPESSTSPTSKPNNLRVDLPPPPDFSSTQLSTATQTSTPSSTTASLIGQTIAESPSSATASSTAPFSPAVASVATPTPTSKRLSLSDFLARQKAKKQEAEAQAQATHATIPESAEETGSGSGSATLASQGDSLISETNAASAPNIDIQPETLSIANDVEMKDVGPSTSSEIKASLSVASAKDEHKSTPPPALSTVVG